jgi:hypothetical protein
MPVCEAVSYQMTFDYMIPQHQDKCGLYMNVGISDPAPTVRGTTPYLGYLPIPLKVTPWTTFVWNISSGWYTEWFYVGLGCDGSITLPNATIYLDNFAVRAIGSLEPPGCAYRVFPEDRPYGRLPRPLRTELVIMFGTYRCLLLRTRSRYISGRRRIRRSSYVPWRSAR